MCEAMNVYKFMNKIAFLISQPAIMEVTSSHSEREKEVFVSPSFPPNRSEALSMIDAIRFHVHDEQSLCVMSLAVQRSPQLCHIVLVTLTLVVSP